MKSTNRLMKRSLSAGSTGRTHISARGTPSQTETREQRGASKHIFELNRFVVLYAFLELLDPDLLLWLRSRLHGIYRDDLAKTIHQYPCYISWK